MPRSLTRFALLAAFAVLAGTSTAQAAAVAPVAAPLSADPAGAAARGTMIMVHAGGWAGHDAAAQAQLMARPGALLRERGWRVVSVDYREGVAGVQDVLDALAAERARRAGDGPVCLYGESAGGHLALVAAARTQDPDCVIALGAPTDLVLYREQGAVSLDARIRLVVSQITRLFGATSEQLAPWNLAELAPSVRADVLLLHEGDDTIVPAEHNARFEAARPTTQTVELEAGDPADPSTTFVHGTASAAGRAAYAAAIGAFADRAVTARAAERRAAGTGCDGVTRSLADAGPSVVTSALRCLARRDDDHANASGDGRLTRRARGEVNAARAWSLLRSTRTGRRMLGALAAGRARATLRSGDPSQITLRVTR